MAAPGAFFAAWTYRLLQLTPEVNKVIGHFYRDITHAYWDKERDYVDAKYATIPFPFKEIQAPELFIIKSYTMAQLLGYLRTWSGVRHYIEKEQTDPTLLILKDLEQAWGSADVLEAKWAVHVRAGYVS